MLHKARLFFALSGTLFLAACMDEPIEVEDASTNKTLAEITEVQVNSNVEEVEESEATSEVEDVEGSTGSNEDTEETVDLEINEDTSNVEQLDFNFQKAIERIVSSTGIDLEAYSFSVEESEKYIEISVYEKTEEQAHSPLQGKYRYMFDSGEILVQDYLTGAYIPIEDLDGE